MSFDSNLLFAVLTSTQGFLYVFIGLAVAWLVYDWYKHEGFPFAIGVLVIGLLICANVVGRQSEWSYKNELDKSFENLYEDLSVGDVSDTSPVRKTPEEIRKEWEKRND